MSDLMDAFANASSCALDDGALSAALAQTAAKCNAVGVHFLSYDRRTLAAFPGIASLDEADEVYVRDFAADDPRVGRMMATRAPVFDQRVILTEEERRGSAVFNEFLKVYEAEEGVFATPSLSPQTQLCVACFRPAAFGAFTQDEQRVHAALGRDMALVARLRAAGVAAAEEATLRAKAPAVLLDAGSGRVLHRDGLAEALLRKTDALSIRGGRPRAFDRRDQTALEMRLAAGARGAADPSALMLRASDGAPALAVHVDMLTATTLMRFDGARPPLILTLTDLRPDEADLAAIIEASTGLSPSEARLAAAIAAGLSVSAYAERVGRSADGCRWSLKQIYARLGVTGQPALAALAARLCLR